MKAIAFRVSFFESFFKVHYTKAFRLSYPTLLPSSAMGLIGNICGYDRKKLDILKEFCYGATYLSGEVIEENVTFIQFKEDDKRKRLLGIKAKNIKPLRYGVVKTQIYDNSEHIVVVAGEEDSLKEKILNRLKLVGSDLYRDEFGEWYLVKMQRYSYGGQNDFFAKEVRVLKMFLEVEERDEVLGYIPFDKLNTLEEHSQIEVLPVRTKNYMKYFAFIKIGKAKLKERVKTVLGIPIYEIDGEFVYL